MKKTLYGAAGLSLLWTLLLWMFPEASLFSGKAEALSTAEIFQRCSPSVATLLVTRKDGKQSLGTAFVTSAGRELLTNFHIVDGAVSITVYFSEQTWYNAKRIVAQDPEKDLALIWVEDRFDPPVPWLGVSRTRIPEGGDVVVIGSPLGFDRTISTGIVSGYRRRGTTSLLQITAPISEGSSGSPVFDGNGRVVGIAVGAVKNDRSEGINFAVDAEEIAAFLSARPFREKVASKSPPRQAVPMSARKPVPPLSFEEIMAKLELARPGMPASQAGQNLGEPARTEERGRNYYCNTWDFGDQKALLLVWDRNGVVERSTWVEYYRTKEEAAARVQSGLDSAARRLGKPSGSSQGGNVWKRQDGIVVGVEQQSGRDSHMVIFRLGR
ncbi:MAG: S1C family serine protease [Synergistaceae bacterium]|jgi:S1-C subfamily serine protease|nr:S1C family serine protease [Synergistaceae bacterium]